jgi:hypothetical protein
MVLYQVPMILSMKPGVEKTLSQGIRHSAVIADDLVIAVMVVDIEGKGRVADDHLCQSRRIRTCQF